MTKLNIPADESRRQGDAVLISGDYQWRAANSANMVQRFWHEAKMTAIDTLCPPQTESLVLDVGCGSGVISNYLRETYAANVIAVDGNIEAINFGKITYPNVQFIHQLVDDDYCIDGDLDYIYCLELIEHLYEQQGKILLNNFHRLLKQGGKLFLTTPNYHSFWPLIEGFLDWFNLTPKLAGDQHVTHYYPKKIASILRNSNFEVELICTNCFLAPWVAPLSLDLARWLNLKELHSRFHMGSIVILVATKL